MWFNILQGLQTLDLSKTCSVPYIINYCNLTQVRKDTGFVRSIRRVQQATYPAALKHEVPIGLLIFFLFKRNVK